MCRFCELKPINENIGEYGNYGQFVAVINDRYLHIDVCLNRYAVKEDNTEVNELILELDAVSDGILVTLESKRVPIKYCPFCGEKL